MDKLTLIMAMQQPELLPFLLLLDDREEEAIELVEAVDIDTTSIDFSTEVINIPATITPATADIESVDVIATSRHYSGRIIYDEVNTEHVLQIERTVNEDSACEVYVQVNEADVLTDAADSSNYFTFTYTVA